MYDPALGRFTTIDPLAESYSYQSPYVYAANNPIRYIDFLGMGPEDVVPPDDYVKNSQTITNTYNSDDITNTVTEASTFTKGTYNDDGTLTETTETTTTSITIDSEGNVTDKSSKTTTAETIYETNINEDGSVVKGNTVASNTKTTTNNKVRMSGALSDWVEMSANYVKEGNYSISFKDYNDYNKKYTEAYKKGDRDGRFSGAQEVLVAISSSKHSNKPRMLESNSFIRMKGAAPINSSYRENFKIVGDLQERIKKPD